ncbi:hypothetical protein DFH09DRAFT_944205 [Mycena vulgaris]|nr:hypothetical protein DFH09DRAFT_944205 [Mycena vulgaris]
MAAPTSTPPTSSLTAVPASTQPTPSLTAVPTSTQPTPSPTAAPVSTAAPPPSPTVPTSTATPTPTSRRGAAPSTSPNSGATTETACAVRPTLVACPTGAADWFANGYAAMTQVSLGCHFDALIAAWTRIEYASRFEHSSSNLSTKDRPKQVGTWIALQRGKRGAGPPEVTDSVAYAAQWQLWWDSLQPAWRGRDANGAWSVAEYGEGGKDWGPLYRWGVNGALSLVASLYFWGCGVLQRGESAETWETAVCDVTWMLEGMAIYYEKFNRRF